MAHVPILVDGTAGAQTGPALASNTTQTHAIAVNNTGAAINFRLRGPSPALLETDLFKVNANDYLIVPFPATGNVTIVDVSTTHLTPSTDGEFFYVFQADPPVDFAEANDEHYAN